MEENEVKVEEERPLSQAEPDSSPKGGACDEGLPAPSVAEATASPEGTPSQPEEGQGNDEMMPEDESRRNDEMMRPAEPDIPDFIGKDLADFVRKHPEVDIMVLDASPGFHKFCGSRYGKEPLSDLYEDYVSLLEGQKKAVVARMESKAERSTGQGSSVSGESITAEEDKELGKWNRRFPHLKMTVKEFVGK